VRHTTIIFVERGEKFSANAPNVNPDSWFDGDYFQLPRAALGRSAINPASSSASGSGTLRSPGTRCPLRFTLTGAGADPSQRDGFHPHSRPARRINGLNCNTAVRMNRPASATREPMMETKTETRINTKGREFRKGKLNRQERHGARGSWPVFVAAGALPCRGTDSSRPMKKPHAQPIRPMHSLALEINRASGCKIPAAIF